MSVLTIQRLAQETVRDADLILIRWQEAMGRGDFEPKDVSSVIDALLDLRQASALACGYERD
jgi:hypothetical protein